MTWKYETDVNKTHISIFEDGHDVCEKKIVTVNTEMCKYGSWDMSIKRWNVPVYFLLFCKIFKCFQPTSFHKVFC